MKNLFAAAVLSCLFIFGAAGVSAQSAEPRPLPVPTIDPREAQRQREEQQRRNEGFDRMRASQNQNFERSFPSPEAMSSIDLLYRKTKKEERQKLAPAVEDAAKFAAFLRQPNTGLTYLTSDKGCSENPNIVVVSADCLRYAMPGAGGSYSFRVADYRLPRLADITLKGDSFQSNGVRSHEIFVNLGDLPLEDVGLDTKGLKYIVGFNPEPDFQKAAELDRRLFEGIRQDGFLYKRGVKVEENSTYILRTIAYRGTFYRSVGGISYNELDFDKRKDIIVAFRVVRRNTDGAVTILWKTLSKQDSPKTVWNKGEDKTKGKKSDFIYKGK